MKRWVLCLFTLLFLALVHAAAQDNVAFGLPNSPRAMDSMTFNSLTGTVRTQDNRPLRNVRVEVRALATGETIASAYTLPNGSFEFDHLPRGVYEVVATAGVQEARERVEFFQPAAAVTLLLPAAAPDAGLAGGASVSVSQLKVPSKAQHLFAKANRAFQEKQLAKAREEVEKALHAFPDYAQALTLRGVLNLQDNKFDAACADLEAAVKSDSNYAMGYIVLGAAYNATRRFDDSVRVLERGLALQPASWQGRFELSKALLAQGQYEAALRQIDKAASLGPAKYPSIHLVRAHALLGVRNYDQAVAELEQFLGNEPNGADSARARETLNEVRSFMAKGK